MELTVYIRLSNNRAVHCLRNLQSGHNCEDTILHELPISASAAQWWYDDNVPFIEHLLHERYYANLFLYIISFNLYSSPMKKLLGLLTLFYRLGNQCLEILSDLTLTWVYMDSKQQILDLKTCLPCRLPVPGCFSSFLASLEIFGKEKNSLLCKK